MRKVLGVVVAVSLAGCGAHTARQVLPPLGNEAEISVYLDPLPREASRLSFTLASVALERTDGTDVPLELLLKEVSGAGSQRQRLLAAGRVPPGTYVGLVFHFGKATLAAEGRPVNLLVPEEPVTVQAPLSLVRGRAALASVKLRYKPPVGEAIALEPNLSVSVGGNVLTQGAGVCSSPVAAQISVFDKHTRTVIAVLPTGANPEGVALDPDGRRVYVALAGEDQVQVLDVSTGTEVSRIKLRPGDGPRELGFTADVRTLVVVERDSNTVSFVDAVSATELDRVRTGEEPVSLLVDRGARRGYVFNRRSNSITVLDLVRRAVIQTVATDAEPIRGQLSRDGSRLYVIHRGSTYMNVYAVPAMTLQNRIFVGFGASALKVDARTDLVYVGKRDDRRLEIFDPLSLLPIDSIDLPQGVSYLTIDDLENQLLAVLPAARAVAMLDLTSRRLLSLIDVGPEPYFVTVVGERR